MPNVEPIDDVELVAFVIIESGDAGGGVGVAVDGFVDVAVVGCSSSLFLGGVELFSFGCDFISVRLLP